MSVLVVDTIAIAPQDGVPVALGKKAVCHRQRIISRKKSSINASPEHYVCPNRKKSEEENDGKLYIRSKAYSGCYSHFTVTLFTTHTVILYYS